MKYLILAMLLLGTSACNLLRFGPTTDPFYDAVLASDKDNPAALFSQGQLLVGQGRYQMAEAYFKRLTETAPTHPGGWLGLGRCAFELHKFKDARRAFERAREAGGGRPAELGLAAALMMDGQRDEAARLLDKMEGEGRGPSAATLRLRGDLAYMAGQSAQAREFYEKSIQKDPAQPTVRQHLRDLQEFLRSAR